MSTRAKRANQREQSEYFNKTTSKTKKSSYIAAKKKICMVFTERNTHRYLLVGIIMVHILGLFVDIMDIDASQYASISQEMLQSDQWLQVHHRFANYLDKPPLLFWLSAISFKLFGISNVTYKLPSFLFALLAIYSTYQLTKIYYGQRAGRIAAIIIGSVQALYSITMDVRTDTLLLGAVVFAIWQLVKYIRQNQYINLFLGFVGISLAMLSKGPIGLMVPVLAIGTDLILRRQWKHLFKWQWLLGLVIIFVMLLPMMYGLYEQFDKHPEVLINGKTGVSGLYFFFWEQSFGRLTGENVWTNNSGPLFFVHTTLWAFLPWSIILVLALIKRFRDLPNFFRKDKTSSYPEFLGIAGFVLPFIALSMSHYKLPHYIYVVYPLGAMMSGVYLDKISLQTNKILQKGQIILLFLMWILVFILLFYIFTPVNLLVAFLGIVIFGLFVWSIWKLPQKSVLIIASTLTAIGANTILNSQAYPRLLSYQSTSVVGKWLKTNPDKLTRFACLGTHMHAVDFYSGQISAIRTTTSELTPKDAYLYTNDKGLESLRAASIPFDVIKEYEDFAVTRLTLPFLLPKSRPHAVRKRYLVAIYPQPK